MVRGKLTGKGLYLPYQTLQTKVVAVVSSCVTNLPSSDRIMEGWDVEEAGAHDLHGGGCCLVYVSSTRPRLLLCVATGGIY